MTIQAPLDGANATTGTDATDETSATVPVVPVVLVVPAIPSIPSLLPFDTPCGTGNPISYFGDSRLKFLDSLRVCQSRV